MNKVRFKIFFISLFFLWIPSLSSGAVITSDTVWEGEVFVSEDILVPEGITLVIKAGATIKITPSESTKTDPEYVSPLTEITIRGFLKAEGTEKSPVLFISEQKEPGRWAGIIIDAGRAKLKSCRIRGAETGVYIIKGSLRLEDSVLEKNRYGLAVQDKEADVIIENTTVTENDYGVFTVKGIAIARSGNAIKDNRKKDFYTYKAKEQVSVKEYIPKERAISREYKDEVLLGDVIWRGRIRINGIIRAPEESRLIIMPGTIVEFTRKDTNGDRIGENGLLIQGVLIAKGTLENPIIFRSSEKDKKMGDWDAVNIMNSDGAQNLVEYCQFENAYRGLHFHFSNVAVKGCVFRNNYRGIQFQESAAELSGNYFYKNKSGIQARDSEIIFMGNHLSNNHYGANFLRANLTAGSNEIRDNIREGFRIREGLSTFEENLIDGNRYGLMISDSFYGNFNRNVVSHNIEIGLLLRGVDNIEVGGNFIQGNGFNGISIQDSRAVIKGNNISENGERGIGIISFSGIISENNIIKNGLYAIELEGQSDVSAPMNWFGGTAGEALFDKDDDSVRGRIDYSPVKEDPINFTWPLKTIGTDITWHGNIHIQDKVAVMSGATLAVSPAVKVFFSKGAGLRINGRIEAEGEKQARITFTSFSKDGLPDWDEIFIEHADDCVFSNCDVEYAAWGIHSHFTHLRVEGCHFRGNYGGIRFRSGPVEIKHSLFEGNTIGLRAYKGSAVIAENVFTKNEIGIFVREKGGSLTITRNNIFANSEYNIRLGDFNDEDVNAKENWWGDGNPTDAIYDERKEAGIGRVIYEPFRKEQYKIECEAVERK